jgi:AraC-like DNA-binding protein
LDGKETPLPIQSMSIGDPDHLAAALRDAQVEYLRLGPEPYIATLTAIDLGPVRLQIAADHAHIARGSVAPDCSVLLFGLKLAEERTLLNGVQIRQHDVVHLAPGAPLIARIEEPIEWGALSIRTDAMQAALPSESMPRDEDFLLHQDCAAHVALAGLMRAAGILARRDPARFSLSSVRRAMAEDALRLSLAAAGHPPRMDASFRAVQRRVALVCQMEAFLASRMGEPVYSEDLQQALGVPMRTLHNAVVALHGMSVHRYLRLRRLHLARAALQSGGRSVSHVKIAALSCGFWHLGRFAQDYRELFGELPSDTIAHGDNTHASAV